MALFLSTTINRVDKKGRVSVPSGFRSALAEQAFHGVVLFPSHHHPCLEGFGWAYVEELGQRLDTLDVFSEEQDDLATSVFADCTQLPFDGEGRILVPEGLLLHAGLDAQAAFVGLGRKFQIWDPQAFEARREQARQNVQDKGWTLPKGGAA